MIGKGTAKPFRTASRRYDEGRSGPSRGRLRPVVDGVEGRRTPSRTRSGGAGGRAPLLDSYPEALRASWVWQELSAVRSKADGGDEFDVRGLLEDAEMVLTEASAPYYRCPQFVTH